MKRARCRSRPTTSIRRGSLCPGSGSARTSRGRLGLLVGLAVSLGAGVLRGAPPAATAAGWVLPTEAVTLNEWDGGDGTKSALLRELIAQYEQMHPNVTVKFETDVKSLKVAA